MVIYATGKNRLDEYLCHKSWLSKAHFTWLIVISHTVCLCFALCSQLTYSSQMTRTCVSSLCYDWLMFQWLTIVSHNDVMICFALCSQLTHSSHMTHTCVSSLYYDWLMFLWLTIVSHNDVMTFAPDSHYESRVPRRWYALRTWYVLCFMIRLWHVAQWLIGVIWWISGMTQYEL